MFVPALKIPVASALSFFGNHSATHLMLAGKTPASPNPSADRAMHEADERVCDCVPHRSEAPENHGNGIANASTESIDHSTDENHAQGISRLKREHEIPVIDLIPTEFVL